MPRLALAALLLHLGAAEDATDVARDGGLWTITKDVGLPNPSKGCCMLRAFPVPVCVTVIMRLAGTGASLRLGFPEGMEWPPVCMYVCVCMHA